MLKYNAKLEKMASDILVKNDMMRLPVSLSVIAKNLNIDVFQGELPEGISGAIRYNRENQKFQIMVEKRENFKRQRFTVAHELAHYFLQRNELSNASEIHHDMLYRKTYTHEEEEVDYLASAILMEENMLKKLYELNLPIEALAEIFGVTVSDITVRLMQLGVI